jgi:hypothetical protein
MPPGLAETGDDDFAEIRVFVFADCRERRLDQFDGLGIGEVVIRIAGIERGLVGMPEKEIGRQHRVALARLAHCQITGMFHKPIAFVHQDDGRKTS